jgi:hypothetical protein
MHPFAALPALALALLPTWADATGSEPMESATCRRALDSLEARENALIASRRGPARPEPAALASIEALRRQAARACLGNPGLTAAPKLPGASPAAAPPAARAARARKPAPAPSPTPAARVPKRRGVPVLISSCDADSCVASDGTRLVRAGAKLIGPWGICRGAPGEPLRCP